MKPPHTYLALTDSPEAAVTLALQEAAAEKAAALDRADRYRVLLLQAVLNAVPLPQSQPL